jgi:hypothetical protein
LKPNACTAAAAAAVCAETDGQPDGYFEYLTALREAVIAFKKPVAYVHGDSHYFR